MTVQARPDNRHDKTSANLMMLGLIHMLTNILASPEGIVMSKEDFDAIDSLPASEEFTIDFVDASKTAIRIRHRTGPMN